MVGICGYINGPIQQLAIALFFPAGIVSCVILCAAFIRHYIIDDEFKVFKKEFIEYFKSVQE